MERVIPCDNTILFRFEGKYIPRVFQGLEETWEPVLVVFEVLKETKASYNISVWNDPRTGYQRQNNNQYFGVGKKRWIRKGRTNPFARKTIEDALNHYLARKVKHVAILKKQLRIAETLQNNAITLKEGKQ